MTQCLIAENIQHRDKVSTCNFWLKGERLGDFENLPYPDVLARDIAENLESALEQFRSIYEDLEEKLEEEK